MSSGLQYDKLQGKPTLMLMLIILHPIKSCQLLQNPSHQTGALQQFYIDCLYEVAVYQICWRFFSHCLVRLIACLSVMGEDRSACSWHPGPNQIPGLELAGADMSSLSALISYFGILIRIHVLLPVSGFSLAL